MLFRLSIILGIYAFGWKGILIGPILIGTTLTVVDLYQKYQYPERRKSLYIPRPRSHSRTKTIG